MKPSDALSKDARALLRAARGGDDIPAAERQRVLQTFRERARLDAAAEHDEADHSEAVRAPRLRGVTAQRSRHGRGLPRPVRRAAWAVAAVIATGSLAAFAREGAFDGWGAAIEKMLGTLVGESSTVGAAPASGVPAAGGGAPAASEEKSVAEQDAAEAGELARAADERVTAAGVSSSEERATEPAGEGLQAAAALERGRLGLEPGADLSEVAASEAATQPAAARVSTAPADTGAGSSKRRPPPSTPERSRKSRATGRAHLPGAAQRAISRLPGGGAPSSESAREALRESDVEAVLDSNSEPSASRAKAPTPDPGASDELDLIVMARNALAARRHADARAAAERHARQFPRGAFGEEREAILALCECRETGASERARAFIERRPDSLFAERIRQDCKLVTNLVPGAPPAGTH